jgi:predicted acyl esterase
MKTASIVHNIPLYCLVFAGCAAIISEAQGAEPSRPSEYPSAWGVQFTSAAPLPTDYAFGHQTTVLKKGSVYPPAAKPLPCDVSWERDVPVKLRDGEVMYTDILRPSVGPARLPSIVAWSPYGKTIPAKRLPSGVPADEVTGIYKNEGPDVGFWSCHGYAVVDPDPRGVNKSAGNIHAWGGVDADDAYDVIEWISAQKWSNGKVGLHGTSWLAMVQWLIAAKKPPHLSAIAPWNGTSDIFRQTLFWGGIPDTRFAGAVANHLTGQHQLERFDLMVTQYPFMTDYWADKAADLEAITVPAYVVADVTTDLHRMGTFEGFRRLGSSEKWLRVDNRQEWTDQYDIENEIDLQRFFDHYLKGQKNGWEHTPRVRMSVLDPGGSDRINIPYAQWPIPGTHYSRLYLDGGTHALGSTPSSSASEASYSTKDGHVDFTYRFDKDTQITGYLKAHLWVEAKDTNEADLFLLVEKLDSHGNVLIPAEASAKQYFPIPPPGASGQLRVSMRGLDDKLSTPFVPVQSFLRSDPVPAGKVVAVDVSILPESVQFHAGEQLRLIVSGQQPPPSSGTVEVAGLGSMPPLPPLPTKNVGTDVVHTGGTFDSYLQIPIIEATTSN